MQENITVLLNVEVKDPAITAITSPHVSLQQENEDQANLGLIRSKIRHLSCCCCVDNDIKYRAFLESGAGSSYISSTIANLLRKPPVRKETKRIEMMVNLTLRNIEIYEATIEDLLRNFA